MAEANDAAETPGSKPSSPAQLPLAPPREGSDVGANLSSGGSAGGSGGERASNDGVNQDGCSTEMESSNATTLKRAEGNNKGADVENENDEGGRQPPVVHEAREFAERVLRKQRSISGRILSAHEALAMPAGAGLPGATNFGAPADDGSPAVWDPPPESKPDGAFCMVSVPARLDHIGSNRFVREGYGGLEVLTSIEGLTATDLVELNELVGEREDVNEFFLRPLASSPNPTELETLLNSLSVRREVASILSVYECRDLAPRVFGMNTIVRHMLVKYRLMRHQVETQGSGTADMLFATQKENTQLQVALGQLVGQWQVITDHLKEEKERTTERYRADIKKLMAEHENEKQSLRDQIAALEAKLGTSNKCVESLSSHAFDVDQMMNFLNRNQTKVTGNWRRLEELFKHCTTPPPEWQTLINVTSADDMFAEPGPFNFRHEDDTEEKDNGGDSGPNGNSGSSGSTKPSGRRVSILDLTGDSRPMEQAFAQPSSGTAKRQREVPDQAQWRPIAWDESGDAARPVGKEYLIDEKTACASLVNLPIVWRKLRTDVQLAMRTGLTYHAAMKLLDTDTVAHNMFFPFELSCMLARMMFWNRLDSTYWTTYVPEVYYLRAEEILERWADDSDTPEYWPDLIDYNHDDSDLLLGPDDDEGDSESRDATWEPNAEEKAKIARAKAREDELRALPKRRTSSMSSQSDSVSSAPSAKKRRKTRPSDDRKKTPLTRKDMNELTPEELNVNEKPGPGVTSWRHKGILTTFAPSTSPGFPDYAPNHNGGSKSLKARFRFDEYEVILDSNPGRRVFRRRVVHLLFHKRSALPDSTLEVLSEVVTYMKENALTFWHAGHWVTFDADSVEAARAQAARKKLHDAAIKDYNKLIAKLKASGAPKTILYEPGIWVYPAKLCHWILFDRSETNLGTEPYTMMEQLAMLDRAEPARIQWTGWSTNDLVAARPQEIRDMILPPNELRGNWVSDEHQN
ncbi:hypothetical protein PHYSODRAFT_253755 [Phytophthora sojae]|uniref:Uncharacterized protein n=1 Tax=Phytophthora sojae (strain P6497) TaxID=1094619 RepID=G4YSH9_PHYSP|nr:hypothetical protein PHYSODRAFT_253755 [Phytophthora sojae]EGZ22995.1 hypothetical protein PHYSODRAFT_253755 [Phytophthora sojae]|eukprot:XP_009518283.1 hypothetical protein PHYSODRAFT_253755 [Phytophthora sojae]